MMQLAASPTPIVAGWLISNMASARRLFWAGALTLLGGLPLFPLKLYRGTHTDPLDR